MYEDLKDGLTQTVNLERQVSELEDVIASLECQSDIFHDDLCRILFEGENTETGRRITIDRIKEFVNYPQWLEIKDICIDYCEASTCDGCKYKDATPEERRLAAERLFPDT